MMEKEIRRFLEEKKFVVGVPVVVKFEKINCDFSEWKATKGTEVIKYKDVLKLLKMIGD